MARALAFVFALLLLVVVPTGASGPALSWSVTTAVVQADVNAFLGNSRVYGALGEGGTIVIDVAGSTWSGTLSGGSATMTPSSATSGTAVIGLSRDAALAVANSYDPTNTGLLLVKYQAYDSVSGTTKVLALFNSLKSGAFDSQIKAQPPTAGTHISFQGATGVLRAPDPGSGGGSTDLEVTLNNQNYLVNRLGALYANAGLDLSISLTRVDDSPINVSHSSFLIDFPNGSQTASLGILTGGSGNNLLFNPTNSSRTTVTNNPGATPKASNCGTEPKLPTLPTAGSPASAWRNYANQARDIALARISYEECIADSEGS